MLRRAEFRLCWKASLSTLLCFGLLGLSAGPPLPSSICSTRGIGRSLQASHPPVRQSAGPSRRCSHISGSSSANSPDIDSMGLDGLTLRVESFLQHDVTILGARSAGRASGPPGATLRRPGRRSLASSEGSDPGSHCGPAGPRRPARGSRRPAGHSGGVVGVERGHGVVPA